MIFNIYYINFPKVYEIKMMLSNTLSTAKTVTQDDTKGDEINYKAKFGLNFLDVLKLGEVGVDGKGKSENSKKVLETFEIKTTKSIILDDVVKNSKTITGFNDISEGQLIKIDNVKLSLQNEGELRIIKFFNSGAFKDILPNTNGFDVNGIFNSMFKDYAYKIKGSVEGFDNKVLVKIPLTFESEFESSYGVDDLFIGKVSIIGLYKGKIKIDNIKNSFEFFKDIGQLQNSLGTTKEDDEIQESHYSIDNLNNGFTFNENDDQNDYHYLDLLAIVQNVKIN